MFARRNFIIRIWHDLKLFHYTCEDYHGVVALLDGFRMLLKEDKRSAYATVMNDKGLFFVSKSNSFVPLAAGFNRIPLNPAGEEYVNEIETVKQL